MGPTNANNTYAKQAAGGGTRANAPAGAPTAPGGSNVGGRFSFLFGGMQPGATPGFNPNAGGGPMPGPVVNPYSTGIPMAGPMGMKGYADPTTGGFMSGHQMDQRAAQWNRQLPNQVGQFQQWAREGVQGYGAEVGRDLEKSVGQRLGDLNGIGALRSGAAPQAIDDAMGYYGREVGSEAARATLGAMGMAQEQQHYETARFDQQKADERARRAAKWQAVGQGVGTATSILGML